MLYSRESRREAGWAPGPVSTLQKWYWNAICCCVLLVLLDQITFHLKLARYSNMKMLILKTMFSSWQMLWRYRKIYHVTYLPRHSTRVYFPSLNCHNFTNLNKRRHVRVQNLQKKKKKIGALLNSEVWWSSHDTGVLFSSECHFTLKMSAFVWNITPTETYLPPE